MDPELKRITENVQRLVAMGAPESDIEGYAQSEGYTLAELSQAAMQRDEGRVTIERPGAIRGGLSTLLQGVTLGLSDELGAAVRAAPRLIPGGKSFADAYAENVEAAREGLAATREDRPVTSALTEMGGALGTAVATGGSGLLARPVVGGALYGAAAGAGAADGGPVSRIKGAVGGGLLGGAAGGAVVGAGTVLRPVAAPLMDLIRPATSRLGGLIQGVDDRAAGKLQNALRRAGVNVEDAVRNAEPGETLMDVGGNQVRRLGRAAESIPSRGAESIRQSLDDRAAQAATRIKDALQSKTGLTFEDAVATVDDLAARRATNASPLYDAAYQRSVPTALLDDYLRLPAFQEAYERGVRIANLEKVELPSLAALGEVVDAVPVQAVDYMKRGMDDVISSRMSAGAIGRTEGRALRNRLREMLGEVDEAVPEYAAARASYAGDSAVQEAFEAGLEDFSGTGIDPREVAKKLRELTASEREFYRRGALDALRGRMESVTDFGRNPDVTSRVVGNKELRDRVRQLFDSEDAFNDFMGLMRREQNMVQTRSQVLGGSPTARIQEDVADLTGGQGFRPSDITRPVEAGRKLLDNAVSRAMTGGERVVDQLSPLLTADLFSGSGPLLERLASYNAREAQRRALYGTVPRAAGLMTGLRYGGN